MTRRSTARLIFIIGFIFMFLGSAFLIGTPAGISQASVLVSFLLIIVGIGCAILAIKLNWRSLYLFFAALFFQAGLFLFLNTMHITHIGFSQAWPLLSIFTGTALLPAGWHRYGVFKANYIVLSAAFIFMGSIMMFFALDLVDFSLAQFARDWWPLLVLLTGLTLVLISLATHFTEESKR
jgi:hypothetical protein